MRIRVALLHDHVRGFILVHLWWYSQNF
jgi:hypothetical protein